MTISSCLTRTFGTFAFTVVLATAPNVSTAAEPSYPSKPVHLVVPFPAGGGADNLARLIMPRVAKVLGQPIVIENKAGAGGNVGAELVARAEQGEEVVIHRDIRPVVRIVPFLGPGREPAARRAASGSR